MALLDFTGSPHGGRQRHLPEWQSQPKIKPTTIIDHSIVGSAEGAWQMFAERSALESHFIVDLDGEIWQLMDTDREADANLHANAFAISIETADRGDPDNQPWTVEQLNSLIWLHERLLETHPGIPRQKCPSEAGGGLGYHTLFGAPSRWTPVAKTCPGRARKVQWLTTLLPAFLNPEEDWFEMATKEELRAVVAEEIKAYFGKIIGAGQVSYESTVEATLRVAQATFNEAVGANTKAAAIAARVVAIEEDTDALVEALIPPPEPTP